MKRVPRSVEELQEGDEDGGCAGRSHQRYPDLEVDDGAPRSHHGAANAEPGERLTVEKEDWKRLGDLLKQRYTGWRAAVLAGGPSRGKWIGLKPTRRIPVSTGPLEARILLFDLY